ncbi:uncharacterized protein LOC135460894 [Zonotrichia leucophrys gambelii]|uniref:uncharacterized protein LOC135460894 n=1 Tax=Zonotrichia leucophrys gambelii TaxID=257770 RepID=UPI0031404AEC
MSFIDRLTQAVDRQVTIEEAKKPLLESLAFGNANPDCQQVISAMPRQPSLAEMVEACNKNNWQVQLISILLFRTLVTLPQEKENKALKTPLRQSLLPLVLHCHDEKRLVAQASQETLLCVAEFLKRPDLERLVKNQNLWKFSKCLPGAGGCRPRLRAVRAGEAGAEPAPTLPSCRSLQLAEDRSRAAEHLRRALPYVQSPQEPLRAAAIRFMGMAARHLRGKKEELRLICTALEHLTEDTSSAVSDLARQTLYVLQALQRERYSVFQRVQEHLCWAWRTRPRLSPLGWLRCWSSAES